ncbi:MAG TPA: CYTH and CHAD domain-containing protein, partial [Rhodopila sp.]|nr:CYTH and CHAD domain-containing protein [Rhodopila sp.]
MTTKDGHSPLEIELKLAFPPEARHQIEAHAVFHGPRAAGPRTTHQVSTYFDTPDLALARDGFVLRVRSRNGRRIQTLKSESIANGAAAARGEWEWAVRTDRPVISLLVGTPAATHAASRLEPVLATDINRTTRMLTLGDTEIEAAFDEGFIRAGGKELPVHELELELKSGPAGPLYQLALTLHADLPLRLEPEAKSARGYRLRTGQLPAAHKTPHPNLAANISAVDGFRQILGAALGSLIGNAPAAFGGDPEGVHQMRIAVRRLRTVLVLFKPHLEQHATIRFQDQLRRLGQVLGEARDWDVFTLETLPTAVNGPMRDLLMPPAQARRQIARNAMREELTRPNVTGLVLALAAWAEDEALMPDPAARTAYLADLAPGLLDRLAQKV